MKCHNCFCAILFLIVIAAFFGILIFGCIKGHPWMIYKSWDSEGQYCGEDMTKVQIQGNVTAFPLRDYTNYPYLFYSAPSGKKQICVKECPKVGSLKYAITNGTAQEDIFSGVTSIVNPHWCPVDLRICPAWATDAQKQNDDFFAENCTCSYPTRVLLNRCIPNLDDSIEELSKKFLNTVLKFAEVIPGFSNAVMSLFKLWVPILVCSLLSIVVAYIWCLLLRCITGCLVYFVVIFVPIVLIALGIFLFFYGDNFVKLNDDQTNKYIAYACWIVAAILILLLIFLWKKLKSAIATMKIASKAIGKNFGALFSPFVSLLWLLIFWALIILSCVFVYSVGGLKYNETEKKIESLLDKNCQYLLIFNLVFLIFISAHTYFTNYYAISGAMVKWYFNAQKGTSCGCFCLRAYLIAYTKALGTIAFTTFVMTPIYIIIILLEWAEKKAKDKHASKMVLCIVRCLKCCCKLFEKLMRFLNKTLLTVHQIYNCSWGKAAKITLKILMGDIALTALLNGITSWVLFLSRLVVGAISTLIFIAFIKYQYSEESGYILPCAVVFILAFVISSLVLNLYDHIVDIIFACFLSDKDITQDGANRPMYSEAEMSTMVNNLKTSQASDTKVEGASDTKVEGASDN